MSRSSSCTTKWVLSSSSLFFFLEFWRTLTKLLALYLTSRKRSGCLRVLGVQITFSDPYSLHLKCHHSYLWDVGDSTLNSSPSISLHWTAPSGRGLYVMFANWTLCLGSCFLDGLQAGMPVRPSCPFTSSFILGIVHYWLYRLMELLADSSMHIIYLEHFYSSNTLSLPPPSFTHFLEGSMHIFWLYPSPPYYQPSCTLPFTLIPIPLSNDLIYFHVIFL